MCWPKPPVLPTLTPGGTKSLNSSTKQIGHSELVILWKTSISHWGQETGKVLGPPHRHCLSEKLYLHIQLNIKYLQGIFLRKFMNAFRGASVEEHNCVFFACYHTRPCAEGQCNQAVAPSDPPQEMLSIETHGLCFLFCSIIVPLSPVSFVSIVCASRLFRFLMMKTMM